MKSDRYLNNTPRKSRFHLNLTDRRTDSCIYRVASLLKMRWFRARLQKKEEVSSVEDIFRFTQFYKCKF